MAWANFRGIKTHWPIKKVLMCFMQLLSGCFYTIMISFCLFNCNSRTSGTRQYLESIEMQLKGSVQQCVKSTKHVSQKCIVRCHMIIDPFYMLMWYSEINVTMIISSSCHLKCPFSQILLNMMLHGAPKFSPMWVVSAVLFFGGVVMTSTVFLAHRNDFHVT